MKAYLLHSLKKYKRFSENIELKTILCDKAWNIFNDSGEKETYIFQNDGSLLISVSGKVSYATWKYISANRAILISTSTDSYMLKPFFLDQIVFTLQLDGTDKYTFMIDESQSESFHFKTLTDISNYVEEILGREEELRLEEERRLEEANERAEKRKREKEELRLEDEKRLEEANETAEKKKIKEQLNNELNEYINSLLEVRLQKDEKYQTLLKRIDQRKSIFYKCVIGCSIALILSILISTSTAKLIFQYETKQAYNSL